MAALRRGTGRPGPPSGPGRPSGLWEMVGACVHWPDASVDAWACDQSGGSRSG